MPSTWDLYSQETVGRVLPLTPENEEYVVISMIERWLDQGLGIRDVVLKWNHPSGVIHGCGSGINAFGVSWDSCKYQRDVLDLLY